MQPISVGLLSFNLAASTVVFSIAVRIYVWPRLRRLPVTGLLTPLLLLHAFRHLGAMFIAPGATLAGMPPEFARPTAYGDLASAALALIALALLRQGRRSARAALWIFNLFGTADLLMAIASATRHGAAAFMGATYWIPAFWVPALLVAHFLIFAILVRRASDFPGATRAKTFG